MSAMGGAGYMEENGFGRLIRDSLVEKIWEGTTTVLALDLLRAAQDPIIWNSFLLWVKEVISDCPTTLRTEIQEPLGTLHEGLSELATSYQLPIRTLIPRPALILVGFIASSCYLLEHAIWSYTNGEAERDTDTEVFRRWVLEGGMVAAMDDVRRVKLSTDQRVQSNSSLVFGGALMAKL